MQQGGILPDTVAALPVGSQVEITFRYGHTVQGTVGFTQGTTWTACSDGGDDPSFQPVATTAYLT